MTLIAAAVLWSGYTLGWWAWLAVTDRVPPGPANTIHWPSIMNLIKPGMIGEAVPPRQTPAPKAPPATLSNTLAAGAPTAGSGNAFHPNVN